MAIWRGRHLGQALRKRILLVLAFFGSISILHISTPSVITVDTYSSSVPMSLNVTTMPGNITNVDLTIRSWAQSVELKNILASVPYVWAQRNASIGLAPGLNASIFFSTLSEPKGRNVTFIDPFARKLSIQCATIPESSGDSIQIQHDNVTDDMYQEMNLWMISNTTLMPDGNLAGTYLSDPSWKFGYGVQFGGRKNSTSDPPTRIFDDQLVYSVLSGSNQPYNFGDSVFFLVALRNDIINPDPSRGIGAPLTRSINTQVWSYVQDSNQTEEQAKSKAFLEPFSATFYIYPIGCSLYAENTTAVVRGDNNLISTNGTNTVFKKTPFIRPLPTDAMEAHWSYVLDAIYFLQLGSQGSTVDRSGGEAISYQWLERMLMPTLNATSSSTGFVAFQENLSELAALSYSLLVQYWRTQTGNGDTSVQSNWTPSNAVVDGAESVLYARLRVNGPEVIVGTVMVVILIVVSALSIGRLGDRGNDVVRDGGVIDMISLLHKSSLPPIIAGDREEAKDSRRKRAELVTVVYANASLDTPGGMANRSLQKEGSQASDTPEEQSGPLQPLNYFDMTSKALARLSTEGSSVTQEPTRTKWFSGLNIHYLACILILVLLFCFYVVLIGLWASKTLDHHLFDINRVGQVTQIIVVVTQAWTVGMLAGLAFVVQSISADRIIRRQQVVAALHDHLNAWRGFGSALMSLWRGYHLGRTLCFHLLQVLAIFACVSILHVTTPSVITVTTYNASMPITVDAIRMPGKFNDTGYDASTGFLTYDTSDVYTSIPYLWAQRNSSIKFPPGVNGTVLFSTPLDTLTDDVVFDDPYAAEPLVQCGIVPRAVGDGFEVVYSEMRAANLIPDSSVDFQIIFSYMSSNQTNTTYVASPSAHYNRLEFQFGGEKLSRSSPPNAMFKDFMVYVNPFQESAGHDESTVAFLYASTNKNALSVDPQRNFPGPAMKFLNMTVWSWVQNNSATLEELESRAFQEPLNVTFYMWPIACTLYVEPVSAHVKGDSTLEFYNYTASTRVSETPFIHPELTQPMETQWANVVAGIQRLQSNDISTPNRGGGNVTYTWLELQLTSAVANGTGLRLLESQLSHLAALTYSLLAQDWRTRLLNGDSSVYSQWSPQTATIPGSQRVLYARLAVNGIQLIVGTIAVILLGAACALSIRRIQTYDPVIRDGGVIDMISLLRDSTLPSIIAGESQEHSRSDVRRERAERTMVMYGDATLDVPEVIRHRFMRRRDREFEDEQPALDGTGHTDIMERSPLVPAQERDILSRERSGTLEST